MMPRADTDDGKPGNDLPEIIDDDQYERLEPVTLREQTVPARLMKWACIRMISDKRLPPFIAETELYHPVTWDYHHAGVVGWTWQRGSV